MSRYGARHDSILRGTVVDSGPKSWEFTTMSFDPMFYMKLWRSSSIRLILAVDDVVCSFDGCSFIDYSDRKLQRTFDIKLYGLILGFDGWKTERDTICFSVNQAFYVDPLAQKYFWIFIYWCQSQYHYHSCWFFLLHLYPSFHWL